MLSFEPGAAERVSRNHRQLLDLCDRLEALADQLPHAVDRAECLRIADLLAPFIEEMQRYEERAVFTSLGNSGSSHPGLDETLTRLRAEHQIDACYAEDVADMLRSHANGRPNVSPDAAGFMLRGFFEGVRRHVAFEQQMLLPLVGQQATVSR